MMQTKGVVLFDNKFHLQIPLLRKSNYKKLCPFNNKMDVKQNVNYIGKGLMRRKRKEHTKC